MDGREKKSLPFGQTDCCQRVLFFLDKIFNQKFGQEQKKKRLEESLNDVKNRNFFSKFNSLFEGICMTFLWKRVIKSIGSNEYISFSIWEFYPHLLHLGKLVYNYKNSNFSIWRSHTIIPIRCWFDEGHSNGQDSSACACAQPSQKRNRIGEITYLDKFKIDNPHSPWISYMFSIFFQQSKYSGMRGWLIVPKPYRD
jgi:hypothetical protein